MIVCVEPFLHRQRLHVAQLALIAVGCGKICFELRQSEQTVALWHGTKQKRRVEHVVVEREIVRRNKVDASLLLLLPSVETDFGSHLAKFVFRYFALEKLLARKLQFALFSYARESYNRCLFCCHFISIVFVKLLFLDFGCKDMRADLSYKIFFVSSGKYASFVLKFRSGSEYYSVKSVLLREK